MNLYKMSNQIIKKLFIAAAFFAVCNAWGQSPFQYNQTEKFYPKIPDASAFDKFVNIPQGNYTGVYGFSVPIYSIQTEEFSFPISIDYHGGGIKVDEISGSVGLGWNLNIGGINLSQEVRGLIDDGNAEFDIENPSYFEPNGVDYLTAMNMVGNVFGFVMGYCPVFLPGAESLSEQNPDYFSYSLLNDNGRFIIDSENEYHTIPKDDIDIVNYSKLTDSKGIEYQFSRYILSDNTYGAFNNWLSYAYKIDQIKFPQGSIMTFNYIQVPYKYISNYEVSQKIAVDGGGSQPIAKVPTRTGVTEQLIESIEYKNTVIKFQYSKDEANQIIPREDVNGGAKLDKIEIYYKPPQGNLQLRKEYKINTSYFISPTQNFDIFSNTDYPRDILSKRLKLVSVEDITSAAEYGFEYIEGTENDKKLPHRFSYSTDYWGAYNGANNNQNPIETFVFKPKNSIREEVVWGANKTPDSLYAQIGSLKKIKLPTGGYQEFTYELDEYRNEEFADGELPETRIYFREYYTPYRQTAESDFYDDIELPIEAPDYRYGLDYRIDFDTNALAYDYDGSSPNLPLGQYYYFQIFEDGIALEDHKYILKQGYSEAYKLPKLQQGKEYKIKLFTDGIPHHNYPQPSNVYVRLHLTWAQKEDLHLKNKKTGTLRTRSIILKNADNSSQIKRTFEYKNFTDNLFSGGVFKGRPLYKNSYSYVSSDVPNNFPGCVVPEYIKYKTLYRSPTYLNLDTSFGKSVYYVNVAEIYDNTLNSNLDYRKELEFSFPNMVGYPDESSNVPMFYWPHNEYQGGRMLKERMFDNVGNKVKSIENFYEDDYYFNSQSADYLSDITYALSFGINVNIIYEDLCYSGDYNNDGTNDCVPSYGFNSNYYYITSAWVKHLSTKEENYENGILKMTNTTNYQYSPTYSHLNPVSVTTTNSLGQEIKTEYEYNHPYKKDEPTTVRTYENGAAISVQQTTFQAAGLPQYVFAKKGTSTLDNVPPSEDLKITYDYYDEKGNLTEYTMENGIPVSIIWGYNKQYPIAKVEGLRNSDITVFIGTLQGLSDSGTLVSTSFDGLRTAVNASNKYAMLTCYIYKPLLGVTEIISPNGQKETYEYDSSGRLMHVKDHNGNVLKKIQYNYKD